MFHVEGKKGQSNYFSEHPFLNLHLYLETNVFELDELTRKFIRCEKKLQRFERFFL